MSGDLKSFLNSEARVYEGLRNLVENFESVVDPRRMRIDLLEYYARNFGFEIDREDLDDQRAFVDLSALYVGIKGTKDSFKSLMRSYDIRSDITELYASDFLYSAITDGDIQLTKNSDEIKQKRIAAPDPAGSGNLVIPSIPDRSYVSITGNTAFLTQYSPYGVQVINIDGLGVDPSDLGEFLVDFAIYDGVNTRVYVKKLIDGSIHNFVNPVSVSYQFRDEIRKWISLDSLGNKVPGSLWIGDGINILRTTSSDSLGIGLGVMSLNVDAGLSYTAGKKIILRYDFYNEMSGIITSYDDITGALVVNITTASGSGTYAVWTVYLGPFIIMDLWLDVDGLPKARLDSDMSEDELLECNELPAFGSGAAPLPDYEIAPQPPRVSRYNDPFALYNQLLIFDEKIDSPFISITNRFLIRFLDIPDLSVLTDEFIERATRRVNAMKPIGSEFDGFSYRVSYADQDKVDLTVVQYNSAVEMAVGTAMTGVVGFDGTIPDPTVVNGVGTKFMTEIAPGDFIMIGTGVADPLDFVSTISKVKEVIDDETLILLDNLPFFIKSGLKIAKRVYLKRVFKYQSGTGLNVKYFVRSDIPSDEYTTSYWPSGITDEITMVAVTENFDPIVLDHIDPIFSLLVDPSFVKPESLTIFFLFEIGIP